VERVAWCVVCYHDVRGKAQSWTNVPLQDWQNQDLASFMQRMYRMVLISFSFVIIKLGRCKTMVNCLISQNPFGWESVYTEILHV
jgi:hypothetical protein